MRGIPIQHPVKQIAGTSAAALLHVVLLVAPLVVLGFGWQKTAQPRILLFLLAASLWFLSESTAARATGNRLPLKPQGPARLPLAIGLALLITYWVALVDAARTSPAPLSWPGGGGLLLLATGICLRCVSIRTLGRYFLNEVALLPDQPLVTRGVYAWLRHPSETGNLCVAFGGALLLGSLWGTLAVAALLGPLLLWRIQLEDRLLRLRHATAFEDYARRVPALLPGVRY